jgi:Chitin binding Peritrophin-A domain.
MSCPIPPVPRKPPMCSPPSLIRKERCFGSYHNILDAYGTTKTEHYSTATPYYIKFSDDNTKLNMLEPYSNNPKAYYRRFSDANHGYNITEPYHGYTLEQFDNRIPCLEGRKIAIAPCTNRFLKCVKGKLLQLQCSNGMLFNPATGECANRTNVFNC